jgi:hypothetical protein
MGGTDSSRYMNSGYRGFVHRVHYHLDWYLREAFAASGGRELSMAEIQTGLGRVAGLRPHPRTVLTYNARQFALYQTAPMARAGFDAYRLNESYYALVGEKVSPPRPGCRGPPRRAGKTADTPAGSDEPALAYGTQYRRIRRHFSQHIADFLEGLAPGSAVTSDEISHRLGEETGIRFGDQVIRGEMRKYRKSGKTPTAERVGLGKYRLRLDDSEGAEEDFPLSPDGCGPSASSSILGYRGHARAKASS